MENPGLARLERQESFGRPTAVAERFVANIETVVRDKHEEIQLVLAAMFAGGHVLFEDVPGTAKTVLARSIAQSIDGATTNRIQCTPDLQPADVTGMSVFNQRERDFEFRPGPIFAHVVLVDEINRATPKTQSAMLEAMAERQVTVDGVTRQLSDPFFLLATENPIEFEGTFPLPEAQLDRFLVKTALGYPGADDEVEIVAAQRIGHPLAGLGPVVDLEDIRDLRQTVQEIYADDLLQRWIVDLVRATREDEQVAVGCSVRGSLALERVARAMAMLRGRDFVLPEDVEELFIPVLLHRINFRPDFLAHARRVGWDDAVEEFKQRCLAAAPRPRAEDEAETAPATAAPGSG